MIFLLTCALLAIAVYFARDYLEDKHSKIEKKQKQLELHKLIIDMYQNTIHSNEYTVKDKIMSALSKIGNSINADKVFAIIQTENENIKPSYFGWSADDSITKVINIKTRKPQWVSCAIELMNKEQLINVTDINSNEILENSQKIILEQTRIKSLLQIPIYQENKLIGAIGFAQIKSNRIWSEEEVEFIKLLSKLFSDASMIYKSAKKIEKNKLITQIKKRLGGGYLLNEILDELFYGLKKHTKIDRIGFAFVDYKNERIRAEYSFLEYERVVLKSGFYSDFNETTLSKIIETKKGMISNDLISDFISRPKSKSLKMIIDEGIRSNMIIPLVKNDSVFALLFISSKSFNAYTNEHLQLLTEISKELSMILDMSYMANITTNEMAQSFVQLVDFRDNDTGNHIARMTKYSVAIAKKLKNHEDEQYRVEDSFLIELKRYASIHDIGKVAIPDNILKKAGRLTEQEWEVMKTHPKVGGDIFRNLRLNMEKFGSNYYKMAEDIAYYHHEKWDGTGYPFSLKEKEIPLSARIVAIADVFDAVSSKRVYKEAYSFDRSVDMISQMKGTHFDPVLVDVFLDNIENIKKIYEEFKDN